MGNMLKELEADVWMCNIGSRCNSTTEVNVDINDKNKATINMSGIGIVYGVTLFANHRCGSSLHFGNHRPASRQVRVMQEFRKFRLPVYYRDGRMLVRKDDDCIFMADEEVCIEYTNKRGKLDFIYRCNSDVCRNKNR